MRHIKSNTKAQHHDKGYKVSDSKLVVLIKAATRHFKEYQYDHRKTNSLKTSIKLYEAALDYANENASVIDQAYCHRKLATVLIRDVSVDPEKKSYKKASEHLMQAILKYKGFLQSVSRHTSTGKNAICFELQRTLALQCHVAMELKDGKLLEANAHDLLASTKEFPNSDYELDAHIALYAIYFSRQEIKKATEKLTTILERIEHDPIAHISVYYLVAKTNLVQLMCNGAKLDVVPFFAKEVQGKFWKVFDQHKNELQQKLKFSQKEKINFDRENLLLKKDLMFMLIMKLAQRIQGIPDKHPNESVCEYIVRQTHSVFGKNNSRERHVRKSLYLFVNDIEKTSNVSLAHRFFEIKEPPAFDVKPQVFQKLLGDYQKVLLPTEQEGLSKEETTENTFN